jgi:lipoprotein-anchoring transpeptidase ErfK/SrfK
VTGGDGAVTGTMSADGTTWISKGSLGFGEKYTVVADAGGMGGTASSTVGFTTAEPSNLTDAYLLPDNGETVGIGQPVAIQFDEPVPDREAAQNAITVRTDPPVDGAFYWISDTEVRWRPEHFWASGTKVHVDVDTKGIDLGDGLFGDNNLSSDFTIGRAFVATADDTTKTISVSIDGKVVKTMPTSMGKDSTPTNNGIYIVAERVDSVIMDSSTYGVPVNSPEGYKEVVYDASRISYSGIYVHAAPWSLGDQGVDDVSNGCLNVSPENARWFKENSLRGDIVIAENTVGPPLPGDDGLGDWNVLWDVWKQGDA